jgi:hypothetical protein
VWDPPTPKPTQRKAKWGGVARNKQPNKRGAGPTGGVPRGNPMGAYGNVDNQGAPARGADGGGRKREGKDNRNYDKPWLAPEKKEKAEAKTYAEHVYPDGIGPDTDLINMIERDALLKNPGVAFDDIAELDETKKLL